MEPLARGKFKIIINPDSGWFLELLNEKTGLIHTYHLNDSDPIITWLKYVIHTADVSKPMMRPLEEGETF